MYYSSSILHSAGITSDKGEWLGTTAVDFANFLGVFICVFLVDRSGRRMLLIVSGITMIIASVGCSVAIILNDTTESTLWSDLSIAFLILFVVGFEIGLGPIPWLMMNELAPMQYRGPISSVATMNLWIANFIIAQFSSLLMTSDVKLFAFAVFTFLVCSPLFIRVGCISNC